MIIFNQSLFAKMLVLLPLGFSNIMSLLTFSKPKAIAGNESLTKFIQRIWIDLNVCDMSSILATINSDKIIINITCN